ncbi:MAG: serine hydrolase [Pseudomonadota bacterium]
MLDTTPRERADGWVVSTPENAQFDPHSIDSLTGWIADNQYYHNHHAVLIEHAGTLVYETYLKGEDNRYGEPLGKRQHTADDLHDLRGTTTGVTSLLLGIALKDNFVEALETPLVDYLVNLPIEFRNGAESIQLKHALSMTAGLKWDEWSKPFGNWQNDEYRMHLTNDPIGMVLRRPLEHKPGTAWRYNGGMSEVIAAVIEQISGERIDKFAQRVLFKPLGISQFEWLGSDNWRPSGTPSASSGLRLRARDLAKIGSVVRNHGVWNGDQIVPRDWVRASAMQQIGDVDQGMRGTYGYGLHWWLGESNGIPKYRFFGAFGNGGQQLIVVPERDLVVTIFAGNYWHPRQYMLNWLLWRIVFAHRSHS